MGQGVKITPAQSHCYFAKLGSPNRVPDWCGHHSKRVMGNCDCEVISFKSPLEEALKCLSEFNMSCAVKLEPKETISTVVSGKDVLVTLPTGFWKSLIIQVLVLMKEIMTGKLQV